MSTLFSGSSKLKKTTAKRPKTAPSASGPTTKPQWPDVSDPFDTSLVDVRNETAAQRSARLAALAEAQRISREIDDHILESKKHFERKKRAVKILLLGQAESGKSSVLKNFQLTFTPTHFESERRVWRTIVQLNLIGSIKRILETLQAEWGPSLLPLTTTTATNTAPPTHRPTTPVDTIRRIRMGLSPLLSMETSLNRMLLPDRSDTTLSRGVCVRAGSRWKATLDMELPSSPLADASSKKNRLPSRPGSGRNNNDPTNILAACRQDIITLWADPAVQNVLRRRNVRLRASSGFFMDDVDRIAKPDYQPTDTDIVRARIRTMGIEEHRFVMETDDIGSEYYIYDVGSRDVGTRSMWIPYFDDVQAIVFLAPLAFNQVLEENPTVNRLEDSLCVWQEICANPLLARCVIILFLNKMDVLKSILASGVSVKKYVPSYGDGPTDHVSVTKYFKEKFRGYHKRLSPKPRSFICYETSAIDIHSTSTLLVGVREAILRINLQKLQVM